MLDCQIKYGDEKCLHLDTNQAWVKNENGWKPYLFFLYTKENNADIV